MRTSDFERRGEKYKARRVISEGTSFMVERKGKMPHNFVSGPGGRIHKKEWREGKT